MLRRNSPLLGLSRGNDKQGIGAGVLTWWSLMAAGIWDYGYRCENRRWNKKVSRQTSADGLSGNPVDRKLGLREISWLALATAGLQ